MMARFAGQAQTIGLAVTLVVAVLLAMLFLTVLLPALGNPLALLTGAVIAVVAAWAIGRRSVQKR
jgi:hypothetical protein